MDWHVLPGLVSTSLATYTAHAHSVVWLGACNSLHLHCTIAITKAEARRGSWLAVTDILPLSKQRHSPPHDGSMHGGPYPLILSRTQARGLSRPGRWYCIWMVTPLYCVLSQRWLLREALWTDRTSLFGSSEFMSQPEQKRHHCILCDIVVMYISIVPSHRRQETPPSWLQRPAHSPPYAAPAPIAKPRVVTS